MTDLIVVYITVPSAEAGQIIAEALVREKLAACVNIVPGLQSVYQWRGQVHNDPELLLMAKTKAGLFEALNELVHQLHSYDVPEVIALPIVNGSRDYIDWVKAETE